MIGEEGLRPSERSTADLTAAVESVLSAPGADGIRRLGALGIDAVYAPDVDADVARALDAAPLLEPSGSDAPTSRVWTMVEPAAPPAVDGVPWRPWVAGGQLVLWLLAIVLTAPVRRRESTLEDDAEEVRA
ncbi:MAG: hypothetical protein EON53_05280 [Actinomycetales bacterium]|nr:MAG: hypothetical protein EON53_05280 [Actinomycetales bacterium]